MAIVLVAGTHHTDGIDEVAWHTNTVRGPTEGWAPSMLKRPVPGLASTPSIRKERICFSFSSRLMLMAPRGSSPCGGSKRGESCVWGQPWDSAWAKGQAGPGRAKADPPVGGQVLPVCPALELHQPKADTDGCLRGLVPSVSC